MVFGKRGEEVCYKIVVCVGWFDGVDGEYVSCEFLVFGKCYCVIGVFFIDYDGGRIFG